MSKRSRNPDLTTGLADAVYQSVHAGPQGCPECSTASSYWHGRSTWTSIPKGGGCLLVQASDREGLLDGVAQALQRGAHELEHPWLEQLQVEKHLQRCAHLCLVLGLCAFLEQAFSLPLQVLSSALKHSQFLLNHVDATEVHTFKQLVCFAKTLGSLGDILGTTLELCSYALDYLEQPSHPSNHVAGLLQPGEHGRLCPALVVRLDHFALESLRRSLQVLYRGAHRLQSAFQGFDLGRLSQKVFIVSRHLAVEFFVQK